jgi:hypothetical protein
MARHSCACTRLLAVAACCPAGGAVRRRHSSWLCASMSTSCPRVLPTMWRRYAVVEAAGALLCVSVDARVASHAPGMDGAGAQGHACCLPALQEVVVAMVEFLEPPAHMLHLVQALLQWNAIRRGEPARGCCRARVRWRRATVWCRLSLHRSSMHASPNPSPLWAPAAPCACRCGWLQSARVR